MFVASEGSQLRFWDVATGKERNERKGNFGAPLATAINSNGRLLAAAAWGERAVCIWDTSSGKQILQLPLKGNSRYTRDLTFSTDGRTLAVGLYRGAIQEWNVATGKEVQSLELDNPPNALAANNLSVHLSADRQHLVTVDQIFAQTPRTRLTIWNPRTGKPLRQCFFTSGRPRCAWSAGRTLVLGLDTGVVLVDTDTGAERFPLDGSAPGSITVTISADGRLVAAMAGTRGRKLRQ